jgi:glycosyltransferase involved in cell wall biosynthesis
VLKKFGGVYLDCDCEVLNGKLFDHLVDELIASDEYDAFVGVEDFENGYPTAQTIAAKKGAEIVDFMYNIYDQNLSGPLWHWRAKRLLIGPQLMSLYFLDKGHNVNDGFFPRLKKPVIVERVKIYPADYFSPKFTTLGTKLNISDNTCIYHMFANLNVDEVDPEAEKHRQKPMLFNDYCQYLKDLAYNNKLPAQIAGYRHENGKLNYEKIIRQCIKHPIFTGKKIINYALK